MLQYRFHFQFDLYLYTVEFHPDVYVSAILRVDDGPGNMCLPWHILE